MAKADSLAFARTTTKEPHLERARRILVDHPELKALCGNTPVTSLFVVGLVAAQVGLAWALSDRPWWMGLLVAWFVGAVISHGLWVLIHECTHNLVFKGPRANAVLQMVANLPILFPAAIGFRKYHLIHHRMQGSPEYDADLASEAEARFVGNSAFMKAFWLLNFWAFQALRVGKLKIQLLDGWYVANVLLQVAFVAGSWVLLGPGAVLYMFFASIFAIGLHPVGARWIQEHYLVHRDSQETSSYYGPMNALAFNVGFHNEHHDVMRVPWMRLPQVRRIAPEFYESLHSHTSWTRLLLRFIFDPSISLFSRMTRGGEATPREVSDRQAADQTHAA